MIETKARCCIETSEAKTFSWEKGGSLPEMGFSWNQIAHVHHSTKIVGMVFWQGSCPGHRPTQGFNWDCHLQESCPRRSFQENALLAESRLHLLPFCQPVSSSAPCPRSSNIYVLRYFKTTWRKTMSPLQCSSSQVLDLRDLWRRRRWPRSRTMISQQQFLVVRMRKTRQEKQVVQVLKRWWLCCCRRRRRVYWLLSRQRRSRSSSRQLTHQFLTFLHWLCFQMCPQMRFSTVTLCVFSNQETLPPLQISQLTQGLGTQLPLQSTVPEITGYSCRVASVISHLVTSSLTKRHLVTSSRRTKSSRGWLTSTTSWITRRAHLPIHKRAQRRRFSWTLFLTMSKPNH